MQKGKKKRPVEKERETIATPSSLVRVFLVPQSRKRSRRNQRESSGEALFFVALFPAWAPTRSQELDEETHI